jgi:hypothetical protein
VKVFSTVHAHTCIGYLTGGHSFSVPARVFLQIKNVPYFLFTSCLFFNQPQKSFTISFLQIRGSLSIAEDQDDLQVVNVVQYPRHVQKTEVLSGNPPS